MNPTSIFLGEINILNKDEISMGSKLPFHFWILLSVIPFNEIFLGICYFVYKIKL